MTTNFGKAVSCTLIKLGSLCIASCFRKTGDTLAPSNGHNNELLIDLTWHKDTITPHEGKPCACLKASHDWSKPCFGDSHL